MHEPNSARSQAKPSPNRRTLHFIAPAKHPAKQSYPAKPSTHPYLTLQRPHLPSTMLNAAEQRPVLPSDHVHHTPRPDPDSPSTMTITTARNHTKRYLTSKYGHYSVLALVSVDITAIFADLILQLLTCEGRIPARDGDTASNVLGIFSLIFSCLFMLELVASVWAFGWT